jgi:hypothetical protein
MLDLSNRNSEWIWNVEALCLSPVLPRLAARPRPAAWAMAIAMRMAQRAAREINSKLYRLRPGS